MTQVETAALNYAKSLFNNPVILDFCRAEALEQVASEIRTKTGSGTTAKAVELLEIRHPNIRDRVEQYTAAGVVGCALVGVEKAAAR